MIVAHPLISLVVQLVGLVELTERGAGHRLEKRRARAEAAELHALFEIVDCFAVLTLAIERHSQRIEELGVFRLVTDGFSGVFDRFARGAFCRIRVGDQFPGGVIFRCADAPRWPYRPELRRAGRGETFLLRSCCTRIPDSHTKM